jgi:uncharacterized protein
VSVPRQCPICKRPVVASQSLPFCSEQCRLVDLGRWLGGDYRVAGAPLEQAEESAPRAPAATEPEPVDATGTGGDDPDKRLN